MVSVYLLWEAEAGVDFVTYDGLLEDGEVVQVKVPYRNAWDVRIMQATGTEVLAQVVEDQIISSDML